jgi:hypothetical protein
MQNTTKQSLILMQLNYTASALGSLIQLVNYITSANTQEGLKKAELICPFLKTDCKRQIKLNF